MAAGGGGLSGSLQRFRLDGISDTGITVGDGGYATVLQYEFRGGKCAGKKIHRLLYEHAHPAERARMLRRFEEECELLSRLHHPNIVQFLGIHVETGSALPVLVMEYLPTNLTCHLDNHGVPPANDSYRILRDVVLGLRYLHEHSPPIIHRDLSANNVLLTANLTAKISDLGVAKILNISPSQKTPKMSTKAPGTPCYMPPEALMAHPSYTSKIDSFSFGVMILHMLCGEWPFPTDLFQHDPNNPPAIIPVSEVERRVQFIEKIGREHPLYDLVCQCLSNIPDNRPEAVDILQQMDTMIPAPPETVFKQLQILRGENQRLEADNQSLSYEVRGLENKVEGLERENERLVAEMGTMRYENQQLSKQNRTLSKDIESLCSQVSSLKSENQKLGSEVERLRNKEYLLTQSPGTDRVVRSVNLKVTITEAKFVKDYKILTRTDLYSCRIRVGSNVYETLRNKSESRNPHWNKTTVLGLPQGVQNMHIEIFIERFLGPIAWGSYKFPERLFNGETVEEWVELSERQGERKIGNINMILSIVPADKTLKSSQTSSYHIDVLSRKKTPKVCNEDSVKHLKEIFSNLDEDIIRSVLETNNGQMDSAVTALMEM